MTTNSKVLICFLSGLVHFATNLTIGLLSDKGIPRTFLWTTMVVPGFTFGLVLVACCKQKTSLKRIIPFLILSTVLHYVASLIAIGEPIGNPFFDFINFPLGATFGAVGLFLAVKGLLDIHLSLIRGLGYALLTGLASALIPFLSIESGHGSWNKWPESGYVLSIFITWQTLFGWTLDRARTSHEDLPEDPVTIESDTVF